MNDTTAPPWIAKRTPETEAVEKAIRSAGFTQVDAYRYNSASIRLRVIDPRFTGLGIDQRDALVEPHLAQLPMRTQADILMLLTLAPSELQQSPETMPEYIQNLEFENPSPSIL